jgi:hypothetical protein
MKSKKQKINSKTRKHIAKRKNIRKTIKGGVDFKAVTATLSNWYKTSNNQPVHAFDAGNLRYYTKINSPNEINEDDARYFIVKLENGKFIDLGPRLKDIDKSDGYQYYNYGNPCKRYFKYINYLNREFQIRGKKTGKISCADYQGRDDIEYNDLINNGEWYYFDIEKVQNQKIFAN